MLDRDKIKKALGEVEFRGVTKVWNFLLIL